MGVSLWKWTEECEGLPYGTHSKNASEYLWDASEEFEAYKGEYI